MASWNARYYTLDHWRGIAALWVMVFHGFSTTYQNRLHPLTEGLKAISEPGWLAVHLFFVISGYCITASLDRAKLHQETTWDFLKNRFWRLYPTYWLAFLFTILLNLIASPFNRVALHQVLPSSWQWWLGNAFLLQPYLGVSSYVVVYWSLVVEVGFYLMAAGLFVIWNRWGAKPAAAIGLILGIISLGLQGTALQMSPLGAWSEFLCGALVYQALLAQSQNHSLWQYLSLAGLGFLGAVSLWQNFSAGHSQLWFSALFALGLYFLYPVDRQLAQLKALNWLRWMGLISYSLYLLHVPFQGRVINLGSRLIPVESPGFLILQVLGWFVAIGISYLFYTLIENPLNIWRHQRYTLTKKHYESLANR